METTIPLANKYRPHKLSDLVGQEVPIRILTNSFKNNGWHHAYILAGGFGSGKSSAARIMAAMENCENGPTLEPCGKCPRCIEIFDGTSIDVKEIDAASNRSIDDIRNLQDEIASCPIYSKMKYVIIDESHGLTNVAADATLKTIEEPPPHVRFILCTTEEQAIKDTIASRCINLHFSRIGWMDLFTNLVKIAKMENMDFEEDALKIIAKSSQGSARNSLQNLQTALNYCGSEKIVVANVQKSLGVVDQLVYFKFLQSIFEVNAPETMKTINSMLITGGRAKTIIEDLTENLRNLQLYLVGGKEIVTDLSDEEMKWLGFLAGKTKPSVLYKMISSLIEVHRGLYVNVDFMALLENFAIGAMIEVVEEKKRNQKKNAEK